MLYLLRPYSSLRWSEVPGSLLVEAASDPAVDLAKLPWQLSELPMTTEMIEVALRHGVACSRGIVVTGEDVSTVQRPAELSRVRQDAAESRRRAYAPALEEYRTALTGAGNAGEIVRAADRERTMLLAVSPKDELVKQWQLLGGVMPS